MAGLEKYNILLLLQKLSALDIHYHSTQYLSSLQVLHSYLPSDQEGALTERRYLMSVVIL